MVVISMEKAPESLRGELTRWCLEIRPGVFVGTLTAQVRDLLWKKIQANTVVSGAILIYTYPNEQGFEMKSHGTLRRRICDFDGIALIQNTMQK